MSKSEYKTMHPLFIICKDFWIRFVVDVLSKNVYPVLAENAAPALTSTLLPGSGNVVSFSYSYRMSKKCWPIIYSDLLYKMSQDFLNMQ